MIVLKLNIEIYESALETAPIRFVLFVVNPHRIVNMQYRAVDKQ